ncbi:MAG: hypothetical protein V4476_19610 [Pseudomonadota bacterium]
MTTTHKMSVGELIRLLRQFPSGMPVLGDGYESGFDEITEVKLVAAGKPKFNDEWAGEFEQKDNIAGGFFAVHIGTRG